MLSRRHFLASASALPLAGPALGADKQATIRARPIPMNAVRLKPSPWKEALEAKGVRVGESPTETAQLAVEALRGLGNGSG